MRPDDLDWCRNAIREGSYSFHAASKLLPANVRDPALALYAFCRVADDEVDFGSNKPAAVLRCATGSTLPMRAAPATRLPTAPLPG